MAQGSGRTYLGGAIAAVAIAVALGKGWRHVGGDATQAVLQSRPAHARAFEPQRFLLNALLAPALDGDAVPLRFVDPRRAASCAKATTVEVNGAPLVPGALVPDLPFDLDWNLRACRPFGAAGPRFDGHVRLHVFREDWGFTAIVDPVDLRLSERGRDAVLVQRGTLSMPQAMDDED